MATSVIRALQLAALLVLANIAQAAVDPPPAYKQIALPKGVPAEVLYSVALTEQGPAARRIRSLALDIERRREILLLRDPHRRLHSATRGNQPLRGQERRFRPRPGQYRLERTSFLQPLRLPGSVQEPGRHLRHPDRAAGRPVCIRPGKTGGLDPGCRPLPPPAGGACRQIP